MSDVDPMANTCRRLEHALQQTEAALVQTMQERDALAARIAELEGPNVNRQQRRAQERAKAKPAKAAAVKAVK